MHPKQIECFEVRDRSTSRAPSPAPAPTFIPGPPSPTRCMYRVDDVLLILDSGGASSITLDYLFNFDTTTCLIYAETIKVSGKVSLPGKSLGLFCSTLDTDNAIATISVAGAQGSNGNAVSTGAPNPGGDGTAGGTIWLYVEDMTEILATSLRLTAAGGPGGSGGQSMSAEDRTGGSGGKGGSGGV